MPYLLPHRYRFAHDYSIFLYDLIVAKLKAGIDARIFDVRFSLTKRQRRQMSGLEGEQLYTWLEQNYGWGLTAEMDYKLVMRGLLTDLTSFVLEGLRASAKGKTTVAYVLFRKPFRDNLFYLEWLLADAEGFLVAFKTKGPEAIDVGKLTPEFRGNVIARAVELCDESAMKADFLYDLRYNRRADYGLAAHWDQAAHLITTWTHGRTDPQNFNFIFSGMDQIETQWAQLYRLLPILLYHAARVTDALIETIGTADEDYDLMTAFRRDVGFAVWADSVNLAKNSSAQMMAVLNSETLGCPSCGERLRFHKRNAKAFAVRGTLRCSACRTKIRADGSADSGPIPS
jgi:hypothetical protein